MKTLHLNLTTPAGDLIGRLPLPEVVVAGAGEAPSDARPQLHLELTDLHSRIRDAVAAERFEIALDDIDFQLAVSRALLADGDELEIDLQVRSLAAETDRTSDGLDLSALDALFELDSLADGGRDA